MVFVHLVGDLDPWSDRLSVYVLGSGGWLMVGAFLCVGFGALGLGATLANVMPRTVPTVVASVAMIAGGVGVIVAGLFPTDEGSGSLSEIVHSRASGIGTVCLVVGALCWTFRAGRPDGGSLTVLSLASMVLAPASAILHDTEAAGIGQRLLWAALVLWMWVAAHRIDAGGAGSR